MATDFDLIVIVIGLGPGGEEVAGQAAQAGWAVLGVDSRLVGGECPYFGCTPSKMILRAADVLGEARRVDRLAGRATIQPDFTSVAARIRDEATDDWDDRVAIERFEGQGGTFVRGTGRLAGRGSDGRLVVLAGEDAYAAPRVVIATGTAPALPPIDGLAALRTPGETPDGLVWTNREAVKAPSAPVSLAVLGGGAVGCELAQGFGRFGSRVTVVEAAPRILMAEEPEASAVVADVLRRDGMQVMQPGGAGDPVDGLFAVGDITGRGAFTHVAVWQARVLLARLFGRDEPFGGYHGLAWATFTDPEVGRVGMLEQQARDAGLRVRTGGEPIPSSSRGWIHGPGNDGFVKLVEDADRGVLVGATVVGPYGGEILGPLTLAVHARVPVATLATMHYAFPTLHRAVLDAVRELR